jgi:tight adherence protein C
MTAGVVMLSLGIMAMVVRRGRAGRRMRSEMAAIERSLPDAVDLLRLAARAGTSIHLLIPVVLPRLPESLRSSFAEVQRRVARGERLGDALDALDSLGEPGEPLVALLRSAAFDGTSLSHGLDRIADDARLIRRRRAEQAARRLPVQLLFPLVICVLPAFVLLAVVPLVAASIGGLSLR